MTSYAEIHLFEERCLCCVELETMGVILLLASERERESLDLTMEGLDDDEISRR